MRKHVRSQTIAIYTYVKAKKDTRSTPVGVIVQCPRDDIGMAALGFIPLDGQLLCKIDYPELYNIIGDANRPRKIIKKFPMIRKLLRLSTYEYDTELFNTYTHFRLPICNPYGRNPTS